MTTEKLFYGHYDIAIQVARRYYARYRDDTDEVEQLARIGLYLACGKVGSKPDDTPLASWLYVRTRRYVSGKVARKIEDAARYGLMPMVIEAKAVTTAGGELAFPTTLDSSERMILELTITQSQSLRGISLQTGIPRKRLAAIRRRALDKMRVYYGDC